MLAQRGLRGCVFEADSVVGGLARTVEWNGFRFDLGGHRFFTKIEPVARLWEAALGEELLTRPRLSRIYYDGKFLAYPLRARDVPTRLGIRESLLCVLSYLRSRRNAPTDPETFEEWVTVRFGRRLYDAFFRSYTEKVWGIPGCEIRSEWAAQRIQNFSLGKAMLSVLGLRRDHVTTLIEEFRYPRLGPGQMWETFQHWLEQQEFPVRLGQRCVAIAHRHGQVNEVVVRDAAGEETVQPVDALLSTIALRDLVRALDPPPPPEVLAAAERLRYRALCLVALVTTEAQPFPDNWIYLHDPGTRAGRVQNFGAWSPDMVRPGTTCLGVEYFCFEGDDIWEMSDDDAVELASGELDRIGLIDGAKVVGGVKVRAPKAYPMYDGVYRDAVATIRDHLAGYVNLQTCGRNGLHRYNNQDHSMWTAILAALNIAEGAEHDVWAVNTEASYLEDGVLEPLLDIDLGGPTPAPLPAAAVAY